ncbi:MAG: ABC transporter ATP-binding protein [Acidimicrobiales bacterium]
MNDATTSDQILSATGLVKRFGGVTAVNEVNVSISRGGVLGIMGPNGSGKTTLLNLLTGFLRADAGTIVWQGTNIAHQSAQNRARHGLVRTFQQAMVMPGLTVLENIAAAIVAANLSRRPPVTQSGIVDYLALGRVANTIAGDLSWGDTRLLGIGLALTLSPDLLLMDEPFAGLSLTAADQVSALVKQLRADGHSLCIVDHKVAHLLPLCDQLLVLVNGVVLANGRPDEVVASNDVQVAYLGVS